MGPLLQPSWICEKLSLCLNDVGFLKGPNVEQHTQFFGGRQFGFWQQKVAAKYDFDFL